MASRQTTKLISSAMKQKRHSLFSASNMKTIRLSQGVVSYFDSKDKETVTNTKHSPLVFIHGAIVNAKFWSQVAPHLMDKYRCILPNLPLGAHEHTIIRPEIPVTVESAVELIAEFIEKMEIAPVTLVCNDTGGALTQIVLSRYPDKVDKVVFTNCDAFEDFYPASAAPFVWGNYIPGFWLLLSWLLKPKALQNFVFRATSIAKYPNDDVDDYFRIISSNSRVRTDINTLVKSVNSSYTMEASKSFPSFTRPVHIVWSKDDTFFNLSLAERMAKLFPNASLSIINDSYAFVPTDQPEQLADEISGFLARTTDKSE